MPGISDVWDWNKFNQIKITSVLDTIPDNYFYHPMVQRVILSLYFDHGNIIKERETLLKNEKHY